MAIGDGTVLSVTAFYQEKSQLLISSLMSGTSFYSKPHFLHDLNFPSGFSSVSF
jgi:hypothetical protein